MTDFNTRNFGESRGDTNVAPVEAQTGTVRRLKIASKCHDSGTSYGYAVNDPDGDYTYWTDHIAAISAKDAEIERLRSLLDARPPYYCQHCRCERCGNTFQKENPPTYEALLAERDSLRAQVQELEASADSLQRSLSEAFNTGDGSYKP
jgi:hypothetical protein